MGEHVHRSEGKYLSVSCAGEEHEDCYSLTADRGIARPAVCGACGERCECPCHQ